MLKYQNKSKTKKEERENTHHIFSTDDFFFACLNNSRTEEEQNEYKTKQKEEICSTQGKSKSTMIVSPWIIGWFSLEELS